MVAIAPKDIPRDIPILSCEPHSPLPQWATLPDAGVVLLRAVQPSDSERLRRMFYRLSSETRYRWFFVAAPSLPHWAERVAALATFDEQNAYAVVALSGDEIVGIARYDALRAGASCDDVQDTIEVGMLIEDSWQSRRLGTLLAQALLDEARLRGMTKCVARVLGDNYRAIRLAVKSLPGAKTSWGGGDIEFQAQLP